jgi:hypothetical protein
MSVKQDEAMFFDERNNIEIQIIRACDFKNIVIVAVKKVNRPFCSR